MRSRLRRCKMAKATDEALAPPQKIAIRPTQREGLSSGAHPSGGKWWSRGGRTPWSRTASRSRSRRPSVRRRRGDGRGRRAPERGGRRRAREARCATQPGLPKAIARRTRATGVQAPGKQCASGAHSFCDTGGGWCNNCRTGTSGSPLRGIGIRLPTCRPIHPGQYQGPTNGGSTAAVRRPPARRGRCAAAPGLRPGSTTVVSLPSMYAGTRRGFRELRPVLQSFLFSLPALGRIAVSG